MPPTPPSIRITRLDKGQAAAAQPQLATLLEDAVAHGASVSFVPPLDRGAALAYWAQVTAGVSDGSRVLLVAFDGGGLVGTVQYENASVANGAHRAEVQKLLVHSRARRRGIASLLMLAIEREAFLAGKKLLVLDTARGDNAEPLYRKLGWTEVGVIPDYAIVPGGYADTVVFYKKL